MDNIVKYTTDHGEVSLSPAIIRQYLVPSGTNVSDQEVQLFLQLCKYQGLNPFLREVYLVKYGNYPASIVTGKEVFTKRAQANPNYAGIEAGITVVSKDVVVRREGSLKLPGEVLIGGWARVHIKGRAVADFEEVALEEYTGTGPLWKSKPATMIRKVAIVHALREAFPEQFEGLYSQEEMSHIDSSALPTNTVTVTDAPCDAPEALPAESSYANATDITPQDIPLPEPPPVHAKAPAPVAKSAPTAKTTEIANGDYLIPLGRHKGKTLEYVYATEKGWLEWYLTWEKARDPMLTIVRDYLNAKDNADQVGMEEPAAEEYALPWDDVPPIKP